MDKRSDTAYLNRIRPHIPMFPSNHLLSAVTTVNTPMRNPIDAETLLGCLKGRVVDRRWRVYVEALFTEVHVTVLHDLVIDGLVSFNEMSNAIYVWQLSTGTENARWIGEMASFEAGYAPRDIIERRP